MKASRAITVVVAVLLLGGLFVYQNCSPYMSQKEGVVTDDGPSRQPENTGPTSFKIPYPQYGPASSIQVGDLVTTQAGAGLNMAIGGRAVMVRTVDGKTRVDVIAAGLPPNSKVAAHVHVLPCAQGAGGHYKINPSITSTIESNEIWPMMFTDANGVGYGTVTIGSTAGSTAVAVVIHGGPAAAKVACADLINAAPSPDVEMGMFAPVGTAPATIVGRAIMARKANGQTEVRTAVSGLTPATMYASHLHEQDCAGTGGHYKIDTTITDALETNEIWPSLASNAAGQAFGRKVANHFVRQGVYSVVIHNPVGGAKMACANLTGGGGSFLPMEAGLTKNRIIFGKAIIDRQLNGGTTFTVQVNGLAPNTVYMSHVHQKPCAVDAAGGHYKVDASQAAATAANEIWISLTSDASGAATSIITAPHIARPDAMSIVIHDPTDSSKLACADLY